MRGLSALFAALGAVAIVFGLLSVLLLVAGAPTDLAWIGGNFVIGVLLLGWAVIANLDSLRERMLSGEGRRIGKYGTSAVGQVVILLAILGLLGFLSTRHHLRFDWSEAKIHSLSEQTRKILDSLDRDVEIAAFYPPLQRKQAKELLDRYGYRSSHVRVSFVDPNARPDLVQRYAIPEDKLRNGVIRVAIGSEAVQVTEATEEKVTNALLRLLRTGTKKVYFVQGHGEHAIEGKEAKQRSGYSRAVEALRGENYEVASLLLAAKGEVPADADVVVIAGPTRPFLPREHEALQAYLRRGGGLLVAIDPRAKTDLGNDLKRWGVELDDDAVVDLTMSLFGQAMTPIADSFGNHPIAHGLRRGEVFFPMARSLHALPAAATRFTEVVRTSANSWGERDFQALFERGVAQRDPNDLKGPVTVVLAGRPLLDAAGAPGAKASSEGAEHGAASKEGKAGETQKKGKKPEARLVVFGDSDFAANERIDAGRNRDLFVNAVNWALGEVEAIAIRPAHSRASRLQLSAEQFGRLRYLCLFVLPEAIAFLGAYVWWSRRRAPGR